MNKKYFFQIIITLFFCYGGVYAQSAEGQESLQENPLILVQDNNGLDVSFTMDQTFSSSHYFLAITNNSKERKEFDCSLHNAKQIDFSYSLTSIVIEPGKTYYAISESLGIAIDENFNIKDYSVNLTFK